MLFSQHVHFFKTFIISPTTINMTEKLSSTLPCALSIWRISHFLSAFSASQINFLLKGVAMVDTSWILNYSEI